MPTCFAHRIRPILAGLFPLVVAAALLYCTVPQLFTHAVAGMETMLFAAAISGAVAATFWAHALTYSRSRAFREAMRQFIRSLSAMLLAA